MTAADDLDLRLHDWMAATAPTAPAAPAERAIAELGCVSQRPAWLVRTGTTAAGSAGRSTLIRVLLVALLVVALVGVGVLVAARRPDATRPLPRGPLAVVVEGTVPLADGSRTQPAVALLPDGRVVFAGGRGLANGFMTNLSSVVIVDVKTGRSTPAGSLAIARTDAVAVPLVDGRVLVTGGSQTNQLGEDHPLVDTEVFDPTVGTSTPIQPMAAARPFCHCGPSFRYVVHLRATRLGDGRVFVAGGGQDLSTTGFADVFDPVRGTAERVAIGCTSGRGTQVTLQDGRLLLICYDSANGHDADLARIFDPATNQVLVPAQPMGRSVGVATLLADGRVLLAGSARRTGVGFAEVFDPMSNTWTHVGGNVNPTGDVSVALPDGRVVVVDRFGGTPLVFDPLNDSFSVAPPLGITAADAALDLGGGRLLTLLDDDSHVTTIRFEIRP